MMASYFEQLVQKAFGTVSIRGLIMFGVPVVVALILWARSRLRARKDDLRED